MSDELQNDSGQERFRLPAKVDIVESYHHVLVLEKMTEVERALLAVIQDLRGRVKTLEKWLHLTEGPD